MMQPNQSQKQKPKSFDFIRWQSRHATNRQLAVITPVLVAMKRHFLPQLCLLLIVAPALAGCVVYPVGAGPVYPGPAYYSPYYVAPYYGPHYYHPYYGCCGRRW